MGTVLELSNLELPARTQGRTGTVLARTKPAAAVPERAWLTATIRPAGTFGRNDASRLRVLLDALSACASIVVLDLQAARLRSHRAGEVSGQVCKFVGDQAAVGWAPSGVWVCWCRSSLSRRSARSVVVNFHLKGRAAAL